MFLAKNKKSESRVATSWKSPEFFCCPGKSLKMFGRFPVLHQDRILKLLTRWVLRNNWRVKWGYAPQGAAAGLGGAHQHTFENVFLSRNLNQNVPKNAYFFGKKIVKIAAASRALPPDLPHCYSCQTLTALCQVSF